MYVAWYDDKFAQPIKPHSWITLFVSRTCYRSQILVTRILACTDWQSNYKCCYIYPHPDILISFVWVSHRSKVFHEYSQYFFFFWVRCLYKPFVALGWCPVIIGCFRVNLKHQLVSVTDVSWWLQNLAGLCDCTNTVGIWTLLFTGTQFLDPVCLYICNTNFDV